MSVLLPTTQSSHFRKRRSFVRRSGRETTAQLEARTHLSQEFGLHLPCGMLSLSDVFQRQSPVFLEIGFGNGRSLSALAKTHPDWNFIGIETHKPGIGALFLEMEREKLSNIRIYDADAVEVLRACIPEISLDGIFLFFPDPWQKRRHHARRLIQAEFIRLIASKLKPGAVLHLATDWDDYARHMMKVLSEAEGFSNLAGFNQFTTRSPFRPVATKFERRAIRDGRSIWEMQFQKVNRP